ncbi:hypothetical protein LIER_25138 [Lithospermum erythrorhizon]|uniref:Reverse transcriptase zinc-binding domain-containing protein n=1 Tax=Lithospermum erythrorhizon TaxID=34254 RepID=A0AAV3R9H9_LITER
MKRNGELRGSPIYGNVFRQGSNPLYGNVFIIYFRKKIKLRRRGVRTDSKCVLCGKEDENLLHLLLACPITCRLWFMTLLNLCSTGHVDTLSTIGGSILLINAINWDVLRMGIALLAYYGWTKPQQGWIKLNTDAAWVKSTSFGAVGAICRDANGTYLGASYWKLVVAFDGRDVGTSWRLGICLL